MNDEGNHSQNLNQLFQRYDARNRHNVALAGLDRLGIRTSADIFREAQHPPTEVAAAPSPSTSTREELSRSSDQQNLRILTLAGLDHLGMRTSADIFRDAQHPSTETTPAPSTSTREELFRSYDLRNQHNVALAGLDRLGIRTSADIFQAAQSTYAQPKESTSW